MKKWFFIAVACLCFAGCINDSSNAGGSSGGDNQDEKDTGSQTDKDACKSPKVLCNKDCVDLEALHLKDCTTCADGYTDSDDNLANGCEEKSGKTPCSVGVDCDGRCVVLGELHWDACGQCSNDYWDADNDPSNGCETLKEVECEAPFVSCGTECADLEARHWKECGVCADGYTDADGAEANGCEASSSGCDNGLTQCGNDCIDLNALNMSNCNDCAAGYEDADHDKSNGCEKNAAPCANNNEVRCGDACIALGELHWSDCHVCMDGYHDSDDDASNGCETRAIEGSECFNDPDCANLYHTQTATCQNQKCIISACETGYANCDAAGIDGCEVTSASDYHHCGAKGLCSDDDAASENYKGISCKLGEQCLNGACVPVPSIVGCADGTREGFLDLVRFNNIAACGGAWQIPGIHHDEGPACNRNSGNTSANPDAVGCNIEDLCAEGWHVCLGRDDVRTRSESGCDGILDNVNTNEPWLFITRTSSTGNLNCDPDTVGVPLNQNDIFGCGNFGCYATGSDCDPLRLSSHDLCVALRDNCGCAKQDDGSVKCTEYSAGSSCYGGDYGHSIDYFAALNGKTYDPAWDCGNDKSAGTGAYEARDIVKSQPNSQGGVMCCKNQCNKDADCGAGLLCRYNVCVQCIQKEDRTYEGCAEGQTCTSSHVCI